MLLNKQPLFIVLVFARLQNDRKRDISVFSLGAFPKVISHKLLVGFITAATFIGSNRSMNLRLHCTQRHRRTQTQQLAKGVKDKQIQI